MLAIGDPTASTLAKYVVQDTAQRRGLSMVAERPDGSIIGMVVGKIRASDDEPVDVTTLDVKAERVIETADAARVWDALFQQYAVTAAELGFQRVLFRTDEATAARMVALGWTLLDSGLSWNGAGGPTDLHTASPEDGHQLVAYPCDPERFGWPGPQPSRA
ncbi:hypothetical protein [Leifsonia sp. Leaf264]|uniref:hypothetical protein n=1 Tax=Leifsonia sp. Leaf264 TaxID=1736314 RepID=UPI0012FC10EC|nr:hypothetical protein [Leifsonia sp. Leaf264]